MLVNKIYFLKLLTLLFFVTFLIQGCERWHMGGATKLPLSNIMVTNPRENLRRGHHRHRADQAQLPSMADQLSHTVLPSICVTEWYQNDQ